MSSTANYASSPRTGVAALSVANTNRDGTGTLVPVIVAAPNGSRVDRVQFQAVATTTAGMIRLFKTRAFQGTPIATLSAATTTITVTTALPHGRSNGEKVYMVDVFPTEYNVLGATITVSSPTVFTYQVPTAPAVAAASSVGYYVTTPSTQISYLWREIPVAATTPSGTLPAWSGFASTQSDYGYLPLNLGYGWILQASTNNAEAFNLDGSYANY